MFSDYLYSKDFSFLCHKYRILFIWYKNTSGSLFSYSHVIQSRNIITNYYFIDNFVPSVQVLFDFLILSSISQPSTFFLSIHYISTIYNSIWNFIYKPYLPVQNCCFDSKSCHHDKKIELIRRFLVPMKIKQ